MIRAWLGGTVSFVDPRDGAADEQVYSDAVVDAYGIVP